MVLWKSTCKDNPYYKYCNKATITSPHFPLESYTPYSVTHGQNRVATAEAWAISDAVNHYQPNPQYRIKRLCARLPIIRQVLLQRSRRRLLVFLLYSTRCLRFSCSSAATVNLLPISSSGWDGAFIGNECVELLLDGSYVVVRGSFTVDFFGYDGALVTSVR